MDFLVWDRERNGNELTLDVKCRGKGNVHQAMIFEMQWKKRRHDIVVCGKKDKKDQVTFMGWAFAAEVDTWPVSPGIKNKPSHKINFTELRCISTLFEILQTEGGKQ